MTNVNDLAIRIAKFTGVPPCDVMSIRNGLTVHGIRIKIADYLKGMSEFYDGEVAEYANNLYWEVMELRKEI